jgi:hypothetical protein
MSDTHRLSPSRKRDVTFEAIKAKVLWLEQCVRSGELPEKQWPRNHAQFRRFSNAALGLVPWINTTLTSPKGRYADWGRRANAAIAALNRRATTDRSGATAANPVTLSVAKRRIRELSEQIVETLALLRQARKELERERARGVRKM